MNRITGVNLNVTEVLAAVLIGLLTAFAYVFGRGL